MANVNICALIILLMNVIANGHQALRERLVKALDLDETTSVRMQLRNGALAYVGASIATGLYFSLRVFGTEGWAEVRNPDLSSFEHLLRDGTGDVVSTPGFDTTFAELEAFADAITQNIAYPVPERDVVHGIAVMDAAIRSAASDGAVIKLSTVWGARSRRSPKKWPGMRSLRAGSRLKISPP